MMPYFFSRLIILLKRLTIIFSGNNFDNKGILSPESQVGIALIY
jgi:hypothetical protein